MDEVRDSAPRREQLLNELVCQYQGVIRRICTLQLGDEEAAKDAVQDTFLKAYLSLDKFRGDCSYKTWLIKIAVNTCHSLRRSAWFQHVDKRIDPEEQLRSVAAEESKYDEIMEVVMRLPIHLKEVVLLYYWQDMTMCEIAQALGCTQSTVSNRLKRAKKKLADKLRVEGSSWTNGH